MERLNNTDHEWPSQAQRNRAARIGVVKAEMERIDKHCKTWKDSGDRGACYDWNGYGKLRDELEKLRGENEADNI